MEFTQEEKQMLIESLDLSIMTISNTLGKVPGENKEQVRDLINELLNLSYKIGNPVIKE